MVLPIHIDLFPDIPDRNPLLKIYTMQTFVHNRHSPLTHLYRFCTFYSKFLVTNTESSKVETSMHTDKEHDGLVHFHEHTLPLNTLLLYLHYGYNTLPEDA